jgi:hypothetical protein
MGAIIMNYLFIGLFIAIGVIQLCQSLRAHGWPMPTWLAVSLFVLIMLAFVLVPIDAQASISPFTRHGRELTSPSS